MIRVGGEAMGEVDEGERRGKGGSRDLVEG